MKALSGFLEEAPLGLRSVGWDSLQPIHFSGELSGAHLPILPGIRPPPSRSSSLGS